MSRLYGCVCPLAVSVMPVPLDARQLFMSSQIVSLGYREFKHTRARAVLGLQFVPLGYCVDWAYMTKTNVVVGVHPAPQSKRDFRWLSNH